MSNQSDRAPSSNEASPALIVRDITKTFQQRGRTQSAPAVLPTSLQLKPSQSLGIVGESGSGKTTLARMICGLTEPTGGSVTFGGLDVHSRSNWRLLRGRIQMVFQDPFDSLNPRMRIDASIQEPMVLSGGFTRAEVEARTLEMLDCVQLSQDFAKRYPDQLSGGQLQRVGIARALASKPELVVLDEPTSALDWMTRSEIIKLLNILRKELDLTYLVISHDIDAVASITDDIAVMHFGAVVERGSSAQIINQPSHPYTRRLMASVLEPRVGPQSRSSLVSRESSWQGRVFLP
jgi:ABC-type glutathione transport system ATPase component